jgi:hypothetical protein
MVYVQADLSRCLMCKVLRAVESLRFAATTTVMMVLWDSGASWLGVRHRNRGSLRGIGSGVSRPCEAPQILAFLYRTLRPLASAYA